MRKKKLHFKAIVRAKTLPRPAKKASLGAGSEANEGYEVVVPSYENMGTKVSHIYRMTLVVDYLGWFDLELACSTTLRGQ